jgi:DNA polymerase delta subunit 1
LASSPINHMSKPNNNDEYFASQPSAKRLKLTTPTGSAAAPAPTANDPFDYKNLNYKRPDEVKNCMTMFKNRNIIEQGKWPRPQLKRPLDPKKDSIDLQVMDIDYINIDNHTEFTKNLSNCELSKIPKIRMFGVTSEGHSVMVDVYGFMPYFYAPVPAELDGIFFGDEPLDCDENGELLPGTSREDMDASHCSVMRNTMNHLMTDAVRAHYMKMNSTEYVVSVEIVSRMATEGYRTTSSPFFKITVALPGHVATLRGIMEKGINIGTQMFPFLTYESSTVFASRFMIDTDMQGCSWVTIPAEKYTLLNPYEQTSTSQIEVAMNYLDIVAHQPVGEWLKFAPLRVLSFDIECYKVAGEFPAPTVDRNMVTQISNILAICEGNSLRNVVSNVFTLGTSDSVNDLDIRMYLSEEELLEKWRDFVVMVDPDLITGYNILRFDLPYLWERAAHLKLKRFKYMSRITDEEVKMKEAKFQSKAFGKSKSFQFNMTGRILFDLLPVVLRNFKMRNNSLNAISTIFLNEQKEDVDHTQIGGLFAGSPSTRARLVSYCYKDSLLVLQIIDAQKLILPYIMMAMITGVPFAFLLSRGESVKVHTQLIRKARKDGFVAPTRIRAPGDTKGSNDDEGFEGAVVIEPTKDFYEIPIATLDFESLYPSIMRAHNLCYTTWIQPNRIATVTANMTEGEKEDYIVTPKGHYFVTAKTFRGLLPAILDGLIAERGKVKDEMKEAEKAGDKVLEKILNARQLAIKVSANSVYGFTGATIGPLPCLPISESVTAYGRDMIHLTRDTVLNHYNIKNGHKWDSKVIYGDTDSVMVVFGTDDLATSMAMGKEAAKLVTELFPPPIRLAFEKCYWPYLLSAKKRYAGLLWTKTAKYDKLDVKGMETVRRDNCLMVKKMVGLCLNSIIIERSPADAIAYCKALVADLVQNKVDLSQLVISKAFSRDEADYKGVQPHIELNKKLAARKGKQQPYQVGDRIQYVVLKGDKKTPMSMRTEDPIYALENRLPVDPEFYIEMLKKPVDRLLGPILKKRVSEIFVGDHTRVVARVTPLPQRGLITMFTKVVKACVQCKATLEPNESNPCRSCIANSNPVVKYLEVLSELQVAENEYGRLMTHCQTCQGSRYEPIMCGARDCAIFYKRVSSKVALDRASERVAMMTDPDDNKWEVIIHTATDNSVPAAAAAATATEPTTVSKSVFDW